jgi:hypothetical protein
MHRRGTRRHSCPQNPRLTAAISAPERSTLGGYHLLRMPARERLDDPKISTDTVPALALRGLEEAIAHAAHVKGLRVGQVSLIYFGDAFIEG